MIMNKRGVLACMAMMAAPWASAEVVQTPTLAADEHETEVEAWVDERHTQARNWLSRAAHGMDGWFGTPNPDDPARASLRVMMDTTWNRYDGTTIKPRIRGRLKLPALEERFSVMIGDEDLDYDRPGDGGYTDERLNTANDNNRVYDRERARDSNASLALRWSKFRETTGLDVDVGVRTNDLFVRVKGEKKWQLTDDLKSRFEQVYRYGVSSEHMALTTLEFTKTQTDTQMLVNRSRILYTNEDNDETIEWNNSLHRRHDWQGKHGAHELNYGVYVGGNISGDAPKLNSYGPYISYRQPVWRDWLFLQGDAGYYNNKHEDHSHHVTLFGRVEMVF